MGEGQEERAPSRRYARRPDAGHCGPGRARVGSSARPCCLGWRRFTAAAEYRSGIQPVPFGPGQAGHHQLVGMIDQVKQFILGHRAIKRDRVPVPLVEVVTGGDRGIPTASSAWPRRTSRSQGPPAAMGNATATALALVCWLGGVGRFSSSRQAVRFTGLNSTVYSTGGKRTRGHLSRQVPPVLRWLPRQLSGQEAGDTRGQPSKADPQNALAARVRSR